MDLSDHEEEKIERLRRAMYSRRLSQKMGERSRHGLGEEDESVALDWVEEEGGTSQTRVAPRLLGYTRTFLVSLLIASVVFFLIALGFFSYFFAFGGGSGAASPSNISITVSGPPQVSGGELTKLQIVVTNRNRVPLELADLVITYPEGTRSPEDFSTELPTQRISLGSIEPGGSKQGTVPAVFSGKAGESDSVRVELEYRVEDSNAIFVAATEYNLSLGSSPLTLTLDGNTEIISGQPVELTAIVSSNASAPVRDVLVRADYPFGFTLTESDPRTSADGFWELGDFSPGERKTIVLQGIMRGEPGDERTFRVQTGTRQSATSTQISTLFSSGTFAVNISQPFLSLAVSVNKQGGSSVIAAPGDNVTVSIEYENNLSTEITDAVIVARLSGVLVDGTTVRTADGFFRSTDDTVLWDKNTTEGTLARIVPGGRGVVSFSFQMPSSETLTNVTSPRLTISVNAAGKRLSESGVPQNLQSVAQQTIKIATDLQLNAQAVYYANPFGSSGPIPPKAGTETTYALLFTITNTTNKISNAKVVAILPSYVRWIGLHAPGGENFAFDHANGTLVWNLGEIEPSVGIGGTEAKQLAVAIGFTPSTSQIGQQPVLVRSIQLTGIDVATGAQVVRTTTPDVTTNLATVSKSNKDALVGTDPGFSPANASVVK